MSNIRNTLKTIFRIIILGVLYFISYGSHILNPFLSNHSLSYNLTIGPIIGFISIVVSILIIVLLIIAVFLGGGILIIMIDSLFDGIFPDKPLSDEDIRSDTIDDMIEPSKVKRLVNKIKRLRVRGNN